MSNHLAILKNPWYKLLIEGKKTIESRLSQKMNKPYNQIKENDIVYIKESGKTFIQYKFTVLSVEFVETQFAIEMDLQHYKSQLGITDAYINSKQNAKYATFIWVRNLTILNTPIFFHQKGQRSWITDYNPSIRNY